MVLMNGSKAARNAASISNNTKIYGIMGGSASSIGKLALIGGSCLSTRFPNCNKIPLSPEEGLAYMKANNLLSVNPLASGGVGRRMTLILNR